MEIAVNSPLRVLGIESSCDETAAAIVEGCQVRSSVVATQAEMHRQWGGVVPEMASRAHVESILPVLEQALKDANLEWREIDGIAVTHQPGLMGALAVGLSAAKAIAWKYQIPMVGVHHLEGHLMSVLADRAEPVPMPHLALIASGGHTELVLVRDWGDYSLVAQTIDDAAGEALDKGARLMGLGYPGGYQIQEHAKQVSSSRYKLPIGVPDEDAAWSFSGLKTAVLRLVEKEGSAINVPEAAFALQEAVVEALQRKVARALETHSVGALSLVGGVAANVALRTALARLCSARGIDFLVPEPRFCTDNAAMIALAGARRLNLGEHAGFDLDAAPNAPIQDMNG